MIYKRLISILLLFSLAHVIYWETRDDKTRVKDPLRRLFKWLKNN